MMCRSVEACALILMSAHHMKCMALIGIHIAHSRNILIMIMIMMNIYPVKVLCFMIC